MNDIFQKEKMRYCPGCGHTTINYLLAKVIKEMGIEDNVVTIAPAGCGAYIGEIMRTASIFAPHGRGVSVAAGLKRADPQAIVIAYQGDGDFTGIGLADSLHGIRRNENITVLHVNNNCYGMTGGQVAPTSTQGYVSPTTKSGSPYTPIDMCDITSRINSQSFVYRGTLKKHQRQELLNALRKSLVRQQNNEGFSLVEILSPCPTGWEGKEQLEEMISLFRTGTILDGTCPTIATPPKKYSQSDILTDIEIEFNQKRNDARKEDFNLGIIVSGRGGQGIQTLGKMIANTYHEKGFNVSVLPSYGAEKRGGISLCEVSISSEPINCPKVEHPDILVLMQKDSLYLERTVIPGGTVYFDSATHTPKRKDIVPVNVLPIICTNDNPFAELLKLITSQPPTPPI